jgi:hypothetical protein
VDAPQQLRPLKQNYEPRGSAIAPQPHQQAISSCGLLRQEFRVLPKLCERRAWVIGKVTLSQRSQPHNLPIMRC